MHHLRCRKLAPEAFKQTLPTAENGTAPLPIDVDHGPATEILLDAAGGSMLGAGGRNQESIAITGHGLEGCGCDMVSVNKDLDIRVGGLDYSSGAFCSRLHQGVNPEPPDAA